MSTESGPKTERWAWEHRWVQLPPGGIIPEAGSSRHYSTGDWRSSKPRWVAEECTSCLLCWVYCPDSAILLSNGKMVGINYEYCKGCGICAHECPKTGALEMVPENAEVN